MNNLSDRTVIRTRFAPSPTGLLHLGNIRAALFSYLYALREQGIFVLRIEDTDVVRSTEAFSTQLQVDLQWLGLDWQEGPGVEGPDGPYWQSQRQSIYARYYAQLEAHQRIYPCFCTDQDLLLMRKLQLSRGQAPRYAETCKKLTAEEINARLASGLKPAWRFDVPKNQVIEFLDIVKGPQRFESNDIGDFIIRRADGTSPFLFCSVVDDALMQVTHVLRGEDHVANTPRQIMILESLSLRVPHYGHLSMIVGQDGAPLSKRNGSSSIEELRRQGFLPKAIINYMARLGHACDSNTLDDLDRLALHFNLEKISHSPTRFDKTQLLFWQKTAVQALPNETLWAWIGEKIHDVVPADKQDAFIETVRDNIIFPQDAHEWGMRLFGDKLNFSEEDITVLQGAGTHFFDTVHKTVMQQGVDLAKVVSALKAELSISGKQLFMPLRIALTGTHDGPQLAPVLQLMGQEKILERLTSVNAFIK